MTLDGISRGLDPPRSLEENPDAIEMIRKAYQKRFQNVPGKDASLTPARRKMGILPQESIPLLNREGTAPGVYIRPDPPNLNSTIVCLPGVPNELMVLMKDHILPEIARLTQNEHFYEAGFIFQDIGESKFTEFVYLVKDEYPEIWIKTHPRSREKLEVELHLTSFSHDPNITVQMQELYDRLKQQVLDSNGIITEEHPLE
jgi:molybdopterin-biosynthesis enzyme MoeA-like protein